MSPLASSASPAVGFVNLQDVRRLRVALKHCIERAALERSSSRRQFCVFQYGVDALNESPTIATLGTARTDEPARRRD